MEEGGTLIQQEGPYGRKAGERPQEGRGRDWGDTSPSQGIIRVAGCQQKAKQRRGPEYPAEPSKGANPAYILILDFEPLEL